MRMQPCSSLGTPAGDCVCRSAHAHVRRPVRFGKHLARMAGLFLSSRNFSKVTSCACGHQPRLTQAPLSLIETHGGSGLC